MSVQSYEGEVAFDLPEAGKPCKTWYKVFGDLGSAQTPLILLHGGPGCCHDYMLPLAALTEKFDIPTIFYDQFGNGKSTHVQEKNGDEAFFTTDLYKRELDNLIDHLKLRQRGFALLGHSWGGMLASMYATDHHADAGLKKVILSNSPAKMEMWGEAATRLRGAMPEVDAVLKKCEAEGRLAGDEEYEVASMEFYKKHVCRIFPFPDAMMTALHRIEEDPTVYHTMNGPNEFYVIGNLRTWSVIPDLHKVTVDTLLINGEYDEAADSTVQPFFEHIKKVKWKTLAGCSHMSHLEDPERYMETVRSFLA